MQKEPHWLASDQDCLPQILTQLSLWLLVRIQTAWFNISVAFVGVLLQTTIPPAAAEGSSHDTMKDLCHVVFQHCCSLQVDGALPHDCLKRLPSERVAGKLQPSLIAAVVISVVGAGIAVAKHCFVAGLLAMVAEAHHANVVRRI